MSYSSKHFLGQSGQILLIVVLVMVVSLTVGLSLASRSIINLRTAQEDESSQRAFSAAEAGVEQALQTGVTPPPNQQLLNNASINSVTIQAISGSEFLMGGGAAISQDDGVDVWFSSYPDYQNPWTGNLTVYWGSAVDSCSAIPTSNTMAALEIIVISGSKTFPVAKRYTFDPCSTRSTYNKFAQVPGGDIGTFSVASKTFHYRTPIFPQLNNISVSSGLLMRIISLFANTPIAVQKSAGDPVLPPQGNQINSVGASGNTQRKIQVFQAFPKMPSEFFQYIFFHPGSS